MLYSKITKFYSIAACLLLVIMIVVGCKKEKAPEASRDYDDKFVVKDNPNDPVDHRIFTFFQSTGIASFYNDTVYLKPVGDSAGVPRYQPITLSISYTPLGKDVGIITLPENRELLPAILDLFQAELIPQLPKNYFIPSILFVDSFELSFKRIMLQMSDGWASFRGYNTVAVKTRDVRVMNASEKTMYLRSILAGIAARQLWQNMYAKLQSNFLSVSRDIAMPVMQWDVYNTLLMEYYYDPVPAPQELGFLHYISIADQQGNPLLLAPRDEDDIRMFLVAVLSFTTDEFIAANAAFPAVIEKFKIMKGLAKASGLGTPE